MHEFKGDDDFASAASTSFAIGDNCRLLALMTTLELSSEAEAERSSRLAGAGVAAFIKGTAGEKTRGGW